MKDNLIYFKKRYEIDQYFAYVHIIHDKKLLLDQIFLKTLYKICKDEENIGLT